MSDYKKELQVKIRHTKALELLLRKHFKGVLEQKGVTDVCYNGQDTIYFMDGSGQWKETATDLRFDDALAIAKAAATARRKKISELSPILSADLPNGERVQFNIPPSVDNGICIISIRIPSKQEFTMADYKSQGMFEIIEKDKNPTTQIDKELIELYNKKEFDTFLKKAVEYRKTVIFAGKTGSGKTTFAKTFVNHIPQNERLISIEDTKEMVFTKHENSVNLYYSDTAKQDDPLTSSTLLRSCLRLVPDRILLTEVRDGAAFDFIDALKNGHPGSITTMHATDTSSAFSRLVTMYKMNPKSSGMPYEAVLEEVHDLVDIIVCLHKDINSSQRYISDIYFKEVDNVKA